MDLSDRLILQHKLAAPIAKAVGKWVKENGIDEPVFVDAVVSRPSCYVDDRGEAHTGPLVTCNVRIADTDDEDEEDF